MPERLNAAELHGYFETDIFRSELQDAELDRVVLGEDCARWFQSGLRPAAVTGKPVQEDWGWLLAVTFEGQSLWFMLQKWHSTERGWHVWIEARGMLSWLSRKRSRAAAVRLRDLVHRVLMGETRVTHLRWVDSADALE